MEQVTLSKDSINELSKGIAAELIISINGMVTEESASPLAKS